MLRNNLKIAWRNLLKRKGFSLINIVGLTIGFACSVLVFLFVSHHLKYDNFHENSDRIYRVVTEQHREEIYYTASVPPGFAEAFRNDYDFSERVANLVSWEEQQLTISRANEKEKFVVDIAFSEPDFFEIMNFHLLNKNSGRNLMEPNVAYITQSEARRIFGTEDVLDRTFIFNNQETVQIIGVLEDLPATTMINTDIFLSYNTVEAYNSFLADGSWNGIMSSLQCFTLLHPNQNPDQIEAVLPELVKKHRSGVKNIHHYKLQPLADVHFNPDYDGSMNASLLWIFSIIGIFIIAVACINFINISTAQAFIRSKEIGVRKVLGGQKRSLFWQFISETFILSLVSLILGVLLALLLLPEMSALFEIDLSGSLFQFEVFAFAVLLLVLVSFLA
ncbi:MAG: ABC transporter permease, partial [Bacteroidota bacterium]